MDKSMRKILTKTVILGPLIKQKGLNIDRINPEIFEYLPYVHFFIDFRYKTVKDLLRF